MGNSEEFIEQYEAGARKEGLAHFNSEHIEPDEELTVRWSAEDQEYVATHSKYPSLSWLDTTEQGALNGLKRLVAEIESDLD
jgi:hypothetical protein